LTLLDFQSVAVHDDQQAVFMAEITSLLDEQAASLTLQLRRAVI